MYRERRDAMIEALRRPDAGRLHAGTCPTAASTSGSTLPPGLDAKAMLPRAVTARVAYVPGTAFFADGFGAPVDAAVLLLPDPRADPGGRTPAGRRHRGGARAARRPSAPAAALARAAAAAAYDAPSTDLTLTETRCPRPRHRAREAAGRGARRRAVARARRVAALGTPGRRGAARTRASRSRSATSTPTCCRRCARTRRPACVPLLHGETGEDGALREVLELLGRALRRRPAGRLPDRLRQAGRQDGRRARRRPHPASRVACRTRRSASSARPR